MIKKKIIIILIICLSLGLLILGIVNNSRNLINASHNETSFIDKTLNNTTFNTNKEITIKVTSSRNANTPLEEGYEKIIENGQAILYLRQNDLSISIYDKMADYLWYSTYPDYDKEGYSLDVVTAITSGVTIECYESNNSALPEITKYCASSTDTEIKIKNTSNGCKIDLNFKTVAISFSIELTLTGNKLSCRLLHETIVEKEYQTKAMKTPKAYKLKTITMFPYLGSNNYHINGYFFIPDGCGALIRFDDTPYTSAYAKRIYGNDYGIQMMSSSNGHIANEEKVTLPIYGINHGYNQAAILAQIEEGAASAELHSYPYMYSNINLNRTFFKYLTRDRFIVKMNTGDIGIINDTPYPNDYVVSYTFLNGNDANYVGMAKEYQKEFNFTKVVNKETIPLKLDVIMQDYKPGLFGKNYIKMTSYTDLKDIVNSLKNQDINNLELSLIGWNKEGYFDSMNKTPKVSSLLGGKRKYNELIDYLEENNIQVYYYNNPLVVNNKTFGTKVVKKTNLELFTYQFDSSLERVGYNNHVSNLASNILKYQKQYNKLGISNFNFAYVGDASYSFAYSGKTIYRNEMINLLKEELNKLTSYQIGLTDVCSYLYNYLTSYYDTPYESSKYSFETDSVPFIPIILSGYVNLYAPYYNFVSAYNSYELRMVAYNLYPSFIITKEPTYNLRYTNYEYMFTTEYDAWKEDIKDAYNNVNKALRNVISSSIISHSVPLDGVEVVGYDNGVTIIVNYLNQEVIVNGQTIGPSSYYVKKGGE